MEGTPMSKAMAEAIGKIVYTLHWDRSYSKDMWKLHLLQNIAELLIAHAEDKREAVNWAIEP